MAASRVTAIRPKHGSGISVMRKVLAQTQDLIEHDATLTMDEIADAIIKEAKDRAPRLTGNLEDAIGKHIGGRGNKSIVVSVDSVKAPYAVYMHEGMFDFRPGGLYYLGAISFAKSRGPAHEEPGGVGVKFLERGANAAIKKLGSTIWQRRFGRLVSRLRSLMRF